MKDIPFTIRNLQSREWVEYRPRRPSELSSEALARSVEKLARMNRKLARELPIT